MAMYELKDLRSGWKYGRISEQQMMGQLLQWLEEADAKFKQSTRHEEALVRELEKVLARLEALEKGDKGTS